MIAVCKFCLNNLQQLTDESFDWVYQRPLKKKKLNRLRKKDGKLAVAAVEDMLRGQ